MNAAAPTSLESLGTKTGPGGELCGSCPICSSPDIREVNQSPFPSNTAEKSTVIMACRGCGIFWRVFNDKAFPLEGQHGIAACTDPKLEEQRKATRARFLTHLVSLIEQHHDSTGKALLDFGCRDGQLMDIATEWGYACTGIEVVAHWREKLSARYPVYKTLPELGEKRFDAIACIDRLDDSFNPALDLRQMAHRLKSHGVLVLRIANRAPLLELLLVFRSRFNNRQVGGQIYVFNDRAIRLLAAQAGLGTRKVLFLDHKPTAHSLVYRLGKALLTLFCQITGLKWAPGLTYVLQRQPSD